MTNNNDNNNSNDDTNNTTTTTNNYDLTILGLSKNNYSSLLGYWRHWLTTTGVTIDWTGQNYSR